jgi:hypothetical protein
MIPPLLHFFAVSAQFPALAAETSWSEGEPWIYVSFILLSHRMLPFSLQLPRSWSEKPEKHWWQITDVFLPLRDQGTTVAK